ncbi:oligoendopeptidase F [Gregarina niphandrodes]|uniref:Oligoendopeptidase F n=1 Tax=Gregarina niphandrodes TaxID=110365 RepID=A0A023BD98_GRENI|nr:oligoendopeptidase F [Gregarina niphandrodes]EZG87291.1 oligoendopeptidase F [Gregarina niphandrodes]|eukprot:XP_011128668.1 oligoendopeptidase F [Gregarina niphandrodes]
MSAHGIDETVLPIWDMNNLYGYKDLEDSKYLQDFEVLNKRAGEFRNKYYGKLDEVLDEALKEYSDINEAFSSIDQFVKAFQRTREDDAKVKKTNSWYWAKRGEVEGQAMEWFNLQLMRLSDECVGKWVEKSEYVRLLEPWLKNVRLLAPHSLSEEVEKALTLRENWSGVTPVVEYFSSMLVEAEYTFVHPLKNETETLNESRLLSYLHDKDWRVREVAMKTFNAGLASNKITNFSCLSLNQVAGKEAVENKERKFSSIRASRNMANQLTDDIVKALLTAVRTKGVETNKRFYKLKRQVLKLQTGRDEFTWSDRNAPLNFKAMSEKKHEWDECIKIVKESFYAFSETFGTLFDRLVAEGRIDAPATDGKRGGAFCFLGNPQVGPGVFVNYLGEDNDVATVAHECGHAVHGILTYKQPYLMQHPALAIAEVASIFGEMLVFKKLLDAQPNDALKLEHLMVKINDIMNSVVRQISFDRFEELVHNARQEGFVDVTKMEQFWMQTTREFYGEEGEIFTSYADMQNLWSYVPHFHEVPFYVYSYAFADLTVGSLYSLYERKKDPKFQELLIELLSNGSSKPFTELIAPFGLNGASPEFWTAAFTDYLQPMLEQAEKLASALQASTTTGTA